MTHSLIVAAAATLAVAAQPAAPPRYAVEAKDARRVTAVLTYHVSCPELKAKEWYVFAAAAPELPGQANVKTTLSPAGTTAKDRSPLARGLATARVPASTAELKTTLPIRVTYEATLRARTLVELPAAAAPPKVEPLSAAERKLYLAEHGDINFAHDTFQKWLRDEGLVRAKEDDIAFARAAFLRVRDTMKYAYAADLDRRASAVCAAGTSDCGGLAALYAAVLRANGIPARTLYGRWATSAAQDAKLSGVAYYQWHVKAEFYAAGVGWVPADPGAAVEHDRTPDGLRYFGTDAGDFLTLHVESALGVEAGPFGAQTIANLQTPAWWVSGGGRAEPRRATEGWTVETVR
ncbi:transglutaminase-like domain-containing protein [Urbifossiella limnaea]|uniref:Transglutaminase-like superfamily protein n=1 Tax=Urbifossiella limnaea TaxID=2528023 RepID=A0A517XZX7_9BACT|nr:transglutaminase-like domain-containing protein [Urbifossiella limnaea]QDU23062.1 Transglutaminase-like superfamily protein [Urbifossiella limnaea]